MPDTARAAYAKRTIGLLDQLDRACFARDLPAARRIMQRIVRDFYAVDGRPSRIDQPDAVLATYAASIHGWEIDGA